MPQPSSSSNPTNRGGNTYCAIPGGCARHLRRFHQQEAQQRVALFRDMSQPLTIPARLLQRHQSQITRDLLATPEPIRSSDDQHKGQCRQGDNRGEG